MKLRFILRDGQRILQEWQEGDCDMGRWNDVPLVVVPPAPEPVQRWEQEVSLHVDSDGLPWSRHMATGYAVPDGAKARAKLGFDAQGRVWMADKDVKRLADLMRAEAGHIEMARKFLTYLSANDLREAADRLAGPEQ